MSSSRSILAWNLRHGGGSRNMARIVLALIDHGPDIIILSEFRRTTGGQIAAALAHSGWEYQHTTAPATSHRLRRRPADPSPPNALLIASRLPFRLREAKRPEVLCPRAAAACNLRLAELEFNCGPGPQAGAAHDLVLIAAHIPCNGPDRAAREHVFQSLLAAARRTRDMPCLVIGDLNAGRHHLDEAGATFTCTRLLGQLAALGYTDAWRHLNPGIREYSWYSAQGAGFRLDHAWVSPSLLGRLSSCRYDHDQRTSGLSDHSALLLKLA
jgi:exodeoxyribonuclease III